MSAKVVGLGGTKMVRILLGGIAAAALLAGATSSLAATITVLSYDMPNGSGQAHGGTYNYWDRNYTGLGSTNLDNAALTGGLGVLTDGHVETQAWNFVSNVSGTGPYVGWNWKSFGDPTITFHIASASTVNSVAVAVDGSGVGGVFAPLTLTIDGTSYAPTVTSLSATSRLLTVTGLSLTGPILTLTPGHNSAEGLGSWDFLSEVTLTGGAVPEPTTWAMMIMGFGAVGAALRRRRSATVAATA